MPEKLFFDLDPDKRNRIFNAGLREFAEQSYKEASTNNIVKAACISKGSLFQYFVNKEDLYFYILDSVLANLVNEVKKDLSIKGDVFEVILSYAEVEFSWHINNPIEYLLLKRAFIADNSQIYQKTLKRYKLAGDSMYYNLLKDVDTEKLKWDKEKTINIIKWILEGFNNEFSKKIDTFFDAYEMKNAYLTEIKEYVEMMKVGLYRL